MCINITIGHVQCSLHQSNANEASIQLYADHDRFSLRTLPTEQHAQPDIQTEWTYARMFANVFSLFLRHLVFY